MSRCHYGGSQTAAVGRFSCARAAGGAVPSRINPRRGRVLDRRASLEAKLRRSLIVARQFAIDEHDKMLKDP